MYAFIVKRQPLSIQAKLRNGYMACIAKACDDQHFPGTPFLGDVYVRIYYFHRVPSTRDADNISKPIVDALRSHAYPDDNVVVHRTAAIVDLTKTHLAQLSLSGVPEGLFVGLTQALNSEDHVIYIEIGTYSHTMLHFGGTEDDS